MSGRVAVFIDGGYLDKVCEELGIRIDYRQFVDQVIGQRRLLRAYYYHCPPYQSDPPTEDQSRRTASMDKFFSYLRRLQRFEVRLGRLAYRGNDATGKPIFLQKSADILLAIDLVRLSTTNQIETAFLVAGDSDFEPAIKVAKNHGVSVRMLYGGTQRNIYTGLWEACDERIPLDLAFFQTCLRPGQT